ncbi:MAG: G5 domain-containing protein, partial [Dehalococcoidia bacterium]|nr:G5 domain-containing protein [Dehalococcoidia bacterium]
LAETVRDVIRLLDVTFDGDDQVFPSLDTPIVPNMQFTIMTTQVREVSAEEPIAPKVVDEYDPNRAEGDISVTEGVAGIKRVVYSVTYRNGVADAARTVLSSEVVQEAVPTRRVIGTKPRPGASKPTIYVSGGAPAVYRQKLHVVATWYNLDHGAFAADSPHYGTTASGAKAAWGTCAVDPSVIPMYTRFYVPGYGWCTALDTGGGIQGAHIDLFFPNEIGDPGWGVQYLDIYIVD